MNSPRLQNRPRPGIAARAPQHWPGLLLLAALALAMLLLDGCASTGGITHHGRMRDADTLAVTRSLGDARRDDAAFPQQDWWRAFGDPQLDALIDEALAGTPSLAVADARVRQALAQAGLADAARKPTLGASAQYAGALLPETFVPPPVGGEVQGSGVLMLSFKYAPDIWGGKRAQYAAAVGQARAAQVDAQAARMLLSDNIARTYVALSQAHAAREVATAELQRAQHLATLSRQRVDAGIDNQLSLRQAEAAVAGARLQQQAAQQRIDALGNAIAALLGQGPDRALSIAPPTLLQAPAPAVPAVLPSELLGHRADVVAARWRVQAARHGIDAAKARFKPSINLNVLAGLTAVGLSDLFGSDALFGFGGPAISLPIFDGGALRANLSKADADYDLAVAGYNQALVQALREVADAVQSAHALDAQLAQSDRAHTAAQAALQLAETRYQAGLGTQLAVLAARAPLLQAELQHAALQAQRLDAAIALDTALGGGLVLDSPLAAPAAVATAATDNINDDKASAP